LINSVLLLRCRGLRPFPRLISRLRASFLFILILILILIIVVIEILLGLDFININRFIDVPAAVPILWGLVPVKLHIVQHSYCRPVGVPQLQAPLNVLLGLLPVACNVSFESLSEDWSELSDMLLESNKITVKGEHVVHTFVLEALDVYCLVLRQLDQISDFMIIRYRELILVSKTEVVSVNS